MAAERRNRRKRWLAAGTGAVLSAAVGASNALRAEVPWQPLPPQQTDEAPRQMTFTDGGSAAGVAGSRPAVIWNPEEQPVGTAATTTQPSAASKARQTVTFEPIPEGESVAGQSQAPTTVEWVPIPDSETLADGDRPPGSPPPEALAIESQQPSRVPELPPPPKLQALDRSIAFSDGLVGPDIGWYVPNGFRWSQRWFVDASVLGQSRRKKDEDFFGWNNGDATAILNVNVLQAGSWSVGLNTSFRSVYQGDNAAGGATQVGEGVASGFRVATAIGDTGGIAFGGEQVIQWDDKTDTGRNLYLMASKGWWLGADGKDYPLLIANGGFGTGRFANQSINTFDNPLRFACINGVENRSDSFAIDNDLCWSPIGTVSLVMNEWWGMFVEYRSGTAQVAASLNLTGGIPLRLTWGVNFAEKNEVQDWDALTWVFRASFGF